MVCPPLAIRPLNGPRSAARPVVSFEVRARSHVLAAVSVGGSGARQEPRVRARDLAVEYETVGVDSDALDAARLMAEHRLPALLVLDERGAPKVILPASQMIKILVPGYVVEDPTLAAVVDKDRSGARLLGVITASHLLERLLAAAAC